MMHLKKTMRQQPLALPARFTAAKRIHPSYLPVLLL
jgi:hypothetical protein